MFDFNNDVLAATGHRPNKLGGYNNFDKLTWFAECELKMRVPNLVISGMALGWDQAVAKACVNLGCPFIAAIPFKGQEKVWPDKAILLYKELLNKAYQIEVICDGNYASYKMQNRNTWMVDHCSYLLALWNGSEGGTKNCIAYANSKNVTVHNVWDHWSSI